MEVPFDVFCKEGSQTAACRDSWAAVVKQDTTLVLTILWRCCCLGGLGAVEKLGGAWVFLVIIFWKGCVGYK